MANPIIVAFWIYMAFRGIQTIMKYGLEELGVVWLIGLVGCGIMIGVFLCAWFDALDKNKDT